MAQVALTGSQIDSGLDSPYKLGPAQFTYSIPGAGSTWETSAGNYTGSNLQPFTNYSTLNASEANAFRTAIAAWDSLILPNFAEVADNASGHGEVRAAFTSANMGSNTVAYAFQGSNQVPTSIVGDVWLNANNVGESYDYGTDNYQIFLHELGHVLGLKHSFEAPAIPSPYENTRYTIMSYTAAAQLVTFSGGGGSISSTRQDVIVSTPMVLDIKAVQDLYGADPTTRAGNTTYTFNQTDSFLQSIYDAGGTDTLDLSSITRPDIIDLTPGSYSSVALFSVADQEAYWHQFYTPGLYSFIDGQLSQPGTYTWTDNLGIAFGTTIENVIGGSGNDTITGNDADNLFSLQKGGNDAVTGGNGNDGFYFGAAMTAVDTVDGGAGSGDQVGLQGNYSGGLTLGANALVNVETLVLLAGNDTRFGDTAGNTYSYNLTTVDANVAAGQLLTINSNTLRSGENVTFNGAAETNGSFLTYGGQGADQLTGGQQSDGFYFGTRSGVSLFGTSDTLSGQAGTDDQLGLQGNYSGARAVVFGASQLLGIESIVLLSGSDARFGGGGATFSYDLTMNDGNVAAGQTMTVNSNGLRSGETLTFNGVAETNGQFTIFSGAGNDTIIGGSGNDTIYGGAGDDRIYGGPGADMLFDSFNSLGSDTFVYTNVTDSSSASPDHIGSFMDGDKIDLSAIDAIAGTLANDAFTYIGQAGFTHTAGELRLDFFPVSVTNIISGDIDGDGMADFAIIVNGQNSFGNHVVTASDFLL